MPSPIFLVVFAFFQMEPQSREGVSSVFVGPVGRGQSLGCAEGFPRTLGEKRCGPEEYIPRPRPFASLTWCLLKNTFGAYFGQRRFAHVLTAALSALSVSTLVGSSDQD